jgi:hypothetical protein
MTTNQKQIIDALVNEFNRIEAMHKPSTTFSLINVDAMKDKTNEIKRYKMQEEAESLAWDEIANEEARRLVKLFQEDLPTASVQKYGKENRFYDLPSVLIRRDERSSTHPESCVNVEVVVVRRNDVKDSFGNYYNRCVKLNYRYNYGREEFETIEELVSNHYFLESVRNRVL